MLSILRIKEVLNLGNFRALFCFFGRFFEFIFKGFNEEKSLIIFGSDLGIFLIFVFVNFFNL